MISLAACASGPKSEPLASLPVETHWRLQSSTVEGLQAAPELGITLSVSADGIAGDSPCNRYNAAVQWQAGELRINRPVSSKRACVDAARNAGERALYEAFPRVRRAFAQGAELRFELDDGAELVFVAKTDAA